jgi:hypothetical protein
MAVSIKTGVAYDLEVRTADIGSSQVTTAKIADSNVTNTKLASNIRSPVIGVALGYKIARGTTTATATKAVATGLTSVVMSWAQEKSNTATKANNGYTVQAVQTGTATITIYRWKVTSPAIATLVAATTAGTVFWGAIGT